MIHIEIQSIGIALLAAPFGYWDVASDESVGPVFRIRLGRRRLSFGGKRTPYAA